MKLKKFTALIIAIFLGVIGISPITQAQVVLTNGGAKWYNSSLDKTFFEIPADDRDLENFIFSDQKIHYKNWTDSTDAWISENAKITSNLIWYRNYLNFKKSGSWLDIITNRDIATFMTVVNNQYYNPNGKFQFYLWYHSEAIISLYWEKDEDQNYCLNFDLLRYSEVKETHKIKNRCHMKLLDREPFLLFTQIERVGQETPSTDGYFWTRWSMNYKSEPQYKLSFTLPYIITHEDKKYVTFYKAESFILSSLYDSYWMYVNSPIQSVYNLQSGWLLHNSVAVNSFLRQWNQRAFRPYSFSFIEDYEKRYEQIKNTNSEYCSDERNCYITLPVDGTSFFESFTLSVAAQYYNSPAIVNDNTYIEAPKPINGEGFTPLEYDTCDTLAIWCHIGNLGKTFYNTIWKFFFNIWSWFADVIKGIFVWLWEWIKTLTLPIQELFINTQTTIKQVFGFIQWFFIRDLNEHQKLSCDANFNFSISTEERNFADLQFTKYIEENFSGMLNPFYSFSNNLITIIRFIDPVIPAHLSEICTYSWVKRVHYSDNSFIDVFFVMIFVMGIISLFFYRNS